MKANQAIQPVGDEQAAEPSVAVHYVGLLTDYLQQYDIAAATLLAKAGIAAEDLDDPNGRIPHRLFSRACELAADTLNDPCLGLRLGQAVRPEHLGSHGFALASCTTATELLQQHSRYSALTLDAGYTEYVDDGDVFIRHWHSNLPGGAPLGRLQDDLVQASVVELVRSFTNRTDLSPLWASFQHAEPAELEPYQSLFRCPLRFGAETTSLAIKTEWLNIPMAHGNPQLRRIMLDFCDQLVSQLGDALDPPWLAITRRSVLESFASGMPEISTVAAAAGMNDGELKQKLAERNTSFRAFVDELRHGLAMGYVRDPQLSLVDIAFMLGFSEQSAFQRAFKRWTGKAPGAYRRER